MKASALHITVQWAGRTLEVLSWFPSKNRYSEYKFPLRYQQFAKHITLRSHACGTIDLLDASCTPAQPRLLSKEGSLVLPQPSGSSPYRSPSLPLLVRFELGTAPASFLKYHLVFPKHALAISVLFHILLCVCIGTSVPSLNPNDDLPDLPARVMPALLSLSPPPTDPAFVAIRGVPFAETTQSDFGPCPHSEANCTNIDSLLGTQTNQAWGLPWAAKRSSVNRLGLARGQSSDNEPPLVLTTFASPHFLKKGESLFQLAAKHRISPISCIFNVMVNPELLSKRPNPQSVRAGDLVYLPKFCVGDVAVGVVFRSFEWDRSY